MINMRFEAFFCVFCTLFLTQKELRAEVTFRGPTFQQLPVNKVEFSNNSRVWMNCIADGVPKPSVRWTRVLTGHNNPSPGSGEGEAKSVGGGRNKSNGRYSKAVTEVPGVRSVLTNGTLLFHPFAPDAYRQDVHSTTYRCEATNHVGTIVSHDIWVRAVVMQNYEAQVYDEFVISGNTGVLRCHIPSFVSDYVSVTDWLRKPIGYHTADVYTVVQDDGGKYAMFPNGELHVHEVSDEDGRSSFVCRTSHRLNGEKKMSSTQGRLVVTAPQGSVPPRITDIRSTVEALQGVTVILPCAAQGHPVPTYSWYRKASSGANKERSWEAVSYSERLSRTGGSLVIKRVSEDDNGVYQCVVNNTIGQEKTETLLLVTIPLQVVITPSSQVYDIGASVRLRCLITGLRHHVTQLANHVSVYWLRNGEIVNSEQEVTQTPGEPSTLHIKAFNRDDAGMYQCFVKSGQQVAQSITELKIGDAPPQLRHDFPTEALHPGANVSFSCSASGLPQPDVSWTVDETDITSDRRFTWNTFVNERGDTVAFLNITAARVQDGGLYGCTATNRISSQNYYGRLNIYGPPYIRPTRPITAIADNDIRMRCPYAGYPIESVHWERDSLKLPLERRHKMSNDGNLRIMNVQPGTDAGRYTCVVRGNNGQRASRDIELSVLVPPAISPFTFQGGVVVEGMRVRATCYVLKGDLPISISWLKDGQLLVDSSVNIRIIDEYSNLLTIDSVKANHAASYTCVANNSIARANHTATLTVNVLPRWRVEPRDKDVTVGGNVTLDCAAFGSPTPSIAWLKTEGTLPGDTSEVALQFNSRVHQLSNGSLMLQNVLELDRGQYVCQVTNGIGAGLSRVVQLRVNVPPSFERRHVNITWVKGNEARLWCVAHGDLPMDIRWFVNGQPMTSLPSPNVDFRYVISERHLESEEGQGVKSEVVIERASDGHRLTHKSIDVFKCEAKNLHGSSESFIHLHMQEPPNSPLGVIAVALSSRIIRVSWAPPYDMTSPIVRHLIQFKKASELNWIRNVSHSVNSNQKFAVDVGDLSPNTDYHIRVFAENNYGASAASDVVRVSTQQEAPSGTPRNVTAHAEGSKAIRVTWLAPKLEFTHGAILGYSINYLKLNTENDMPLSVKLTERSIGLHHHLLTNLEYFTNFSISVQAFNAQGDGPKSIEVIARTAEHVPSKSPNQISCHPLSSQSISLRWEAPPSGSLNGILLGYKVFYHKRNKRTGISGAVFKNETVKEQQIILQSLDTNTEYLIQILGFTSVGDGVKSEPVTCLTDQDVPEAPADIKAIVMRTDAILLIWKAPDKSNGPLTKYTVYMRTLDRGRELEMTKHVINPFTTQFEAFQVVNRYRYEFWITASTAIGEGKSTKVIWQSPTPSILARIVGFDEQITIKWKSNVTLHCRGVGLPAPTIEWRVGPDVMHSNERLQILSNGTLIIFDAKSYDSNNYTCRARNVYGTDSITYKLLVLSPPSPPILSVNTVTATSINIKWDESDSKGSPIIGYSLSFRREKSEWEEVQLESDIRFYSIDSLHCGTAYEFYMTAFSVVGPGNPSHIAKVRTRGSLPVAPSKNAILTSDMSSVSLLLNGWSGDGCPIDRFSIRYQLLANDDSSKDEWTTVADHVTPLSEPYVVYLRPNSKYLIEIVAFNAAGSTVVNYKVDTALDYLATSMSTLAVKGDSSYDQTLFYWSWTLITPIALCAVLVVAVIVAGCFYMRKSSNEHIVPDIDSSKKYQLATETLGDTDFTSGQYPPVTSYQGSVIATNNKIDPGTDVEPYATFQLRTDGPNYSWKARNNRDLVNSEVIERNMRQKGFQGIEASYSDDTVPDLLYHSQESSISDNLSSPDLNDDNNYRRSYDTHLPSAPKIRNRMSNRCSNLNPCYVTQDYEINKRILENDRLDHIETMQQELKSVLGLNSDISHYDGGQWESRKAQLKQSVL